MSLVIYNINVVIYNIKNNLVFLILEAISHSGDENSGLVDNLCGRQLRARAEIKFVDGNQIRENQVNDKIMQCVPLENHKCTFPTVEQPKLVRGNLKFSGDFPETNYSAYFRISLA